MNKTTPGSWPAAQDPAGFAIAGAGRYSYRLGTIHTPFSRLPLLAAALGAAFIQIGTNLFNDVGDLPARHRYARPLGPRRATAEGWLTPGMVKAGAWLSFALAFLCGIYLVWHGRLAHRHHRPGLAACRLVLYRRAEAHRLRPAGEVFVFIFFGLVAVGGSYDL